MNISFCYHQDNFI